MAILYQVVDWEKTFEGAKSKGYNNKTVCQLPTKHGLGYRRLIRSKNGPAMFGAWCAMIQLISRHAKPRHGYLTDTGVPDGTPLDSEDLEMLTDIPAAIFQEMLKICSSEKLGWISNLKGYHEDTTVSAQYPLNLDLDLDSNLDLDLDTSISVDFFADAQIDSHDSPSKQEKPKAKAKTKPAIHDEAVKSVEIPASLDSEKFHGLWLDFCDERRTAKKYLTERAAQGVITKLAAVSLEAACLALEDSIANSWQGVFPEKAEAEIKRRTGVVKNFPQRDNGPAQKIVAMPSQADYEAGETIEYDEFGNPEF